MKSALTLLLAAVIAAAAILTLHLSRHRAFQVDEVQHVHVAYEAAAGRLLYRDFWEGHNPLLYPLLLPFVNVDDPVGSFRRCRWLPFATLVAIVLIVAFVARRISGPEAGWLSLGLIATHSTMIERGLEIRPDGLLALAVVTALALEVSSLERRRRFVVEALVLGLAFVATQKAVFACAAFALWWLAHAWRRRTPSLFVLPTVAGILPFAAMLGVLGLLGNLREYWRYAVGDAFGRLTRSLPSDGEFGPAVYLGHESRFNLVFTALALWAMANAPLRIYRSRRDSRRLLVLGLSLVSFGSLWLNPFPFPYLHVTFLPLISILIAVEVAAVFSPPARAPFSRAVVVGLVIAAAATALPRLASRLSASQEAQMATLAEVQRITRPEDTVFDLVGLYFRPNAYPVFSMTGVMIRRYEAGYFPRMVPILVRAAPRAVIWNYRLAALGRAEQRFLREHYVHHDGNILVPGREVERLLPGEKLEISLLATDLFRWEGPDCLLVDGRPFREGVLEAGQRVLQASAPIQWGRLFLARATRAPEIIRSPSELYPTFD